MSINCYVVMAFHDTEAKPVDLSTSVDIQCSMQMEAKMNRYDIQDPDHLDDVLVHYSVMDEQYNQMIQLYENELMDREEKLIKAANLKFWLGFCFGAFCVLMVEAVIRGLILA